MMIDNSQTRPSRFQHALITLSIIATLGLGGCAGLMDRHFEPQLDPTQGSLTLTGLTAPVTVKRDAYGIPFVEASTKEDLAMAVGYVNATDRLSQMIGMKLLAEGRLAEMAGPSVLSLDIYLRTMHLKQAAENILKRLSPENKVMLERYCDGVNAYLSRHKDTLPPGLALAGYKPEPWQPLDSMLLFTVITLSLSFNLHEEIAMLSIARDLGVEKTAWLLPIYPDEPIPFDEAAKLKGIDLKRAADSMGPLAELPALLHALGVSGQAASNNWAIAKERTQGGASIFCNDMHLYLSLPSMWNMLHIKCGRLDAAGMNMAGVPCIVAGYNGHIAWGMTMVMADNQDIFLEQLRQGNDGMEYLYKGQWRPATERIELFRVRGRAPVAVHIHETVHGPLLNEALRREPIHAVQSEQIETPYGLALSWAVTAPDDDSVNAFFRLNEAASVEEAISIIRKIRSIPLNMVFADKDDIAWQVIGTYPVRAQGRGLMPSPGWTGAYDWTGLLEAADLPKSKNPPAGFIGTANNRTIPTDYPQVLSSSWYAPERAERIAQMISATDRHTAETCRDMQLDTHSLFVPKLQAVLTSGALADAIVKEIDGWPDQERRAKARQALAMLRAFDGDMRAEAKSAALVGAFLDRAMSNIFLDELGPVDSRAWKAFMVLNNLDYNTTIDHLLVRGDESPFWDDIHTSAKETKAQILARTLVDAVALLDAKLGADTQKWSWGALHTYTWETETSKMAPRMGIVQRTALGFMQPYFDRGPYPAPGDQFTLNVSAYNLGRNFDTWLIPSMRTIVDFSRPEPMAAVNSSGQSDNPSSPHYDDGITAWRTGRYIPFPFQEAAVNAQYREVLTLQPAGPSQP